MPDENPVDALLDKVEAQENAKRLRLPPLYPDTVTRIEHRHGGVWHIVDAQGLTFHDPESEVSRFAVRIIFRELPHHAWWPNEASQRVLAKKLGLMVNWPGAAVPVAAMDRRNPTAGNIVKRFVALPPEDWEDAILASHGMIGAGPGDVP